jgi:hypothetical protein
VGTLVDCDWSANMNSEFLFAQENLTIFLKDGYTFFRANAEILTRRFADPAKTTRVIIVHPDTPFMDAVASMDDKKKSFPESQRSDCLQAVRVMHEIREKLLADLGTDCANRVKFIGQDNVPQGNYFIGDDTAIINLYPTRPHRGSLLSLRAKKNRNREDRLLYQWVLDDSNAILKQAQPEDNLWNYRLPSPLLDLRAGQ